jgi:hypothetical protein
VKKKMVWIILPALLFILLGGTSCEPIDSDGDGWSDVQEMTAATDPNNVDTDNDGYWDPHDPNPLDAEIHEDEVLTEPEAESPAPTPLEPTETTVSTTPEAPSTSTEAPLISPEAAAAEELRQVQNAVKVMMRNNALNELANPVDIPTNDMHQFPDATTRHGKAGFGYVLYLHDYNGDGTPDTNYVHFRIAKGTYTCDKYGRVTQVSTGIEITGE